MKKIRYEEMLPHEIIARRKKQPIAYIGLGGLEWHGEHLAVGNDALKAEKLCELAAEASGGFAMPTLWYGEPRTTRIMEANDAYKNGDICQAMGFDTARFKDKHMGKSKQEQIRFYQEIIFHTLIQMNQMGMEAVCFLSGHYPLKEWVDKAIARFHRTKRFSGTRAWCGIEFNYPQPENHNIAGGDHAAVWETSYLWYLRPDCIDMSIFLGQDDEELLGVMGEDPRGRASIELGRRGCELIVRGMVKKGKEVLKEARA